MKNEAKFSVVIPEGALDASMKPSFEDMCQRYGIPMTLPLKPDSKGRYVVASDLSLAEAQQIRRQISGAGYAVDIQSSNEQVDDEDDISSIAIALNDPDTLVVEGGLLDAVGLDDVSDIMNDAWDSLEFPSPDADISDDLSFPGSSQLGINKDSTLSLTAKQLLNSVLEADKRSQTNDSKLASSQSNAKLSPKAPTLRSDPTNNVLGVGTISSTANSASTRIARQPSGPRKSISLGDMKTGNARLGNSSAGETRSVSMSFGKKGDSDLVAATPASPLNAFAAPAKPKLVNQLIPPSSIAFEVSDVNDALDSESQADDDQLIDVSGEMEAAEEGSVTGIPLNTPASADECSKTTQALAVPLELINCEQKQVRKISTDSHANIPTAKALEDGAEKDHSSEKTVVRSRSAIDFLKVSAQNASEPKEEASKPDSNVSDALKDDDAKIDLGALKEVAKASQPPKTSKFVESEPDPAALNASHADQSSLSSWILVALLACAAILVILTLIDLYVSPLPFIESLAAPF